MENLTEECVSGSIDILHQKIVENNELNFGKRPINFQKILKTILYKNNRRHTTK